MFRKTILAVTAIAALSATALAPTTASAKKGWGWHGHHGFHGFHGFRGFGITLVAPAVASCWRYQWVETRRGLRRILVNVCTY